MCGLLAEELNQCADCNGTYCDSCCYMHEVVFYCPVALYNRTLTLAQQENQKWKLF
jgi:hypothetical protein